MGMGMGDDKESPVQLKASVRSREAAVGHCLVFRIAAQCQPRHGAEREGDYTQHTTQPPRNEQRYTVGILLASPRGEMPSVTLKI